MTARVFDAEAETFDARAGLPQGAVEAVAAAVASFLPGGRAGALLDLGAGTGEIGERLSERCPTYVGLDVSRPMLDVFSRRIPGGRRTRPLLVEADAARHWPLRERSFDVVFSSRAFHRLPLGHAVGEALRACAPGGAFLLGGIRRDPGSARGALRRRLHEEMRKRGLSPRDAEADARRALDAAVRRGGRLLESITVARWRSPRSADETLELWRSRSSLAGVELPRAARAKILGELEPWLAARDGRTHGGEECYVLQGALVP